MKRIFVLAACLPVVAACTPELQNTPPVRPTPPVQQPVQPVEQPAQPLEPAQPVQPTILPTQPQTQVQPWQSLQSMFLGLPPGVVEEDLAFFDEALSSVGCKLVNDSDYLPIEFQTGFTREKVQSIASYKVQKGQAIALENGGVQLVTGPCLPVIAEPTVSTEATAG